MTDDVIRTHIGRFDNVIGGGIPRGHTVLVFGSPGTMKSTLTYSVLYKNALAQEHFGLYFSLEQSRASLERHMRGMGMDPSLTEGFLDIVDLGEVRRRVSDLVETSFSDILMMYIERSKDLHHLLVIDSLPVLEMLARWPDPRAELRRLFTWLREADFTTMIISEVPGILEPYTEDGGMVFGRFGEEFLADGIISLTLQEKADTSLERRIRCVKLRRHDHSLDQYGLMWNGTSFSVRPVISSPVFE